MGLPADHYKVLTPAEVDEIAGAGRGCSHCERPPNGDGRDHIVVDLGKAADFEDTPPGRIVTEHPQLAGRTYVLRTGFTDDRRHQVACVILCSECVEAAGRLVGVGRLAPLQQLLAQANADKTRLAAENAELLAQVEALRPIAGALQTLAQQGNAKPRKPTSPAAA